MILLRGGIPDIKRTCNKKCDAKRPPNGGYFSRGAMLMAMSRAWFLPWSSRGMKA